MKKLFVAVTGVIALMTAPVFASEPVVSGTPAASETSFPEPTTPMEAVDQMSALLGKIGLVLESIKDEASAKKAVEEANQIFIQMNVVATKGRELGRPPESELALAREKIQASKAAMEASTEKLKPVLEANPALKSSVDAISKGMREAMQGRPAEQSGGQ